MVIDIVVAVVLLALFIRGFWVMPRMWRDDYEWSWDRRGPPYGWALGAAMWQGSARGTPVSWALVGLSIPALVLLRVSEETGALQAAFDVVLVAWCACLCMGFTVVLFNRPKWAVVPHLRHQPGVVVVWWRQLRGRGTDDAPTQ